MHAIKVDTATDRFLRIGVSRGSRSLMGGVILDIPITLTIPYKKISQITASTVCYKSSR